MYREVLRGNPRHVEALLGTAWCHIDAHGFSLARQNFQKVLRLSPDNPEAIAGIGVCDLWGLQNKQLARKNFERALEIDPAIPFAHHLLGELARLQKDIPTMLFHFREAYRLDPQNLAAERLLRRAGVPFEHPTGTEVPLP